MTLLHQLEEEPKLNRQNPHPQAFTELDETSEICSDSHCLSLQNPAKAARMGLYAKLLSSLQDGGSSQSRITSVPGRRSGDYSAP